jgi:hypothetical protein
VRKFIASLSVVLGLAGAAFAQTALTSTTLSTATDNKQVTVVVASATGFNAPGLAQAKGGVGGMSTANLTVLYVDREVMDIVAVSSTTITVRRGTQGTAATAHASGATVRVGPASNFALADPVGTCTRTLVPYVPVINVKTGEGFDCVNSMWAGYRGRSVGAAVASASTIAPIGHVTHVTGTTNVVTVTPPPFCPTNGCQITLIPDGLWSTTNAGNLAIASTGVVSKALILTYDAGTSKWYPSY